MLRLSFTIAAGVLLSAAAAGQSVDEYQLKAAFLFNFAKFVEWPPDTFKSADASVGICVLGRNPFGETLAGAVKGKSVDGKAFAVREISDVAQTGGCQILFISSSERKRFHAILGAIKTPGVLTVGEADGFLSEGGIVNFILQEGSVRIQINIEAAAIAKLHISSKLLSLAQVVRK